MRFLTVCFLVLAIALAAMKPSLAASKAAHYLMAQQVKRLCPKGGRFNADAVIERDLTADGKADLILDLGGLICKEGAGGRNEECGAAHCPLYIYVKRGDLLKLDHEVTSVGVKIGAGDPPKIHLVNFDFKEHSMKWDGMKFNYGKR